MKRSSWTFFNSVLSGFRKFPLFKFLYKIPFAPRAYHFTLALVGAALYGFPSKGITVIGVTGTKGKTTTLELLNTTLESAGKKTSLLSSIYIKLGDEREENVSGNTQRGRFFTQYFLRESVKKKCEYALIEVTSLGVSLSRHRFIKWDVAAITNIAPEHIEAHGSFEKYRDEKLKFLQYSAHQGGRVFVNGDDKGSSYFVEKLGSAKQTVYSKEENPALSKKFLKKLSGDFNKENIASAVSIARHLGIGEEHIQKGLETFSGVPGRMEYVAEKPFAVVVDYAHTPDSLEAVYNTLSKRGNLVCVLGSMGAEGDIGGRDKWKRPELGKIAAKHCREIILTNEDPVDEDPKRILKEIRAGIQNDNVEVHEILDRKKAIKKAMSLALSGDTVVITGKGSESYIRVAKGKKIPWSDRRVALEALKKRT